MNVKLIMMMETLRSFIKREDGASAIEYALIAGLIGIVIIGGATFLGDEIDGIFREIGEALNDAAPSTGD
ncbi:Flp family type IVb pilin [Halopseudomonas bauzanensis]|uniref:Flp family type IVb pilin n=1 Tax=Halopseudomonas bauzanensis TaxID=653930 RepID=UPI0035234F18